MQKQFPLVTVLGPTAVGKTTFAANLASLIGGEIISADSRQVFREMDIGTGKDLSDYIIDNQQIPYHLINIAEPGTEYSIFQFRQDFNKAFELISSKGRTTILCGGSGMYLESVLKSYDLQEIQKDENLRQQFDLLTDTELIEMLARLKNLHATTDTCNRERLYRALEIEIHRKNLTELPGENHFINSPVFGIRFSREENRRRITERLKQRLATGMVEEVEKLLLRGIPPERLKTYGLEYKYVTMFAQHELQFEEMFRLLNTAIHQFAKRQMTWFRRMEKNGIHINWLEGENGLSENLSTAMQQLESWNKKK